MASTSTSESKRKNEVMGAFDGIAPSASTCASKPMKKPSYDVFINHRGPDVKSTLASTLYAILTGMALSVFLDSEELEYGAVLPQAIEAAMTSALLHIAIFSERYAESPWCLAELSFMLKSGAPIIPIFYHVDPTDLKYIDQGKGKYVDAFKEHERKGRYSPEQLQEWKKALDNISFYSGEIITNNDDEMRLLKKIPSFALKVIKVPLTVAKHPVGLEEIVRDFEMNTLQSAEGDQGVQIMGIWGMGGSGKTTLAKELYNKRSSSMEWSSFVYDVRDAATKDLLHEKQKKILKDLHVPDVAAFDNIEEGMCILSRHLRSVRVLIVLDDVDHVEQLDALLPAKDNLERGSIIIVTTREHDILRSWGITSVYKMSALNQFHAEQLFCWHAFIQPSPQDGFEELVKKLVKACDGLPLSLKVFGAQLFGESRKECWETLLHKISRILPDDIKQKLKISYDALDDEEKEAFLDTACFFIGEKKSLAIEVWDGSGWSGLHSWERLVNKCLVEFDQYNTIKMHDHLRDLGREIANKHSPCRLWSSQQITNAQKQRKKRNGIRGIKVFPTREELVPNISAGILLPPPSLVGLKLLAIRGDYFNQVIREASRELVWLRWHHMGQRNLRAWRSMDNLRVLELQDRTFIGRDGVEELWEADSNYIGRYDLEELWEADSNAPVQLRELVLSNCFKLQRLPNSIGCLNELKKIVITRCDNLSSLPEDFCCLQSLEHLKLSNCKMIGSLPCRFGDLRNLRYLELSCWRNLRSLPDSFKNLMLLQHLNLLGCEQLILTSEDFQNITKLEFLSLKWCKQLEELPRHITNQASLRELNLDGTERLRELPINIGQLSRLPKLEIGSKLLTSVPTSLGDLSSLTNLCIDHCNNLESLPTSLGDLSYLTTLSISYCDKMKSLPPSLEDLSSLTNLDIMKCRNLESLPTSLGDSSSLRILSISYCDNLKSLPTSLGDLSSLKSLRIYNCPNLKSLPNSLGDLSSLTNLEILWCRKLKCFPFALSNLKRLSLLDTKVCRISISEDRYPCLESVSGDLVNLERLTIKCCPELEELPSFARSTSLEEFELRGCYRIQKIEGLEYCTRLKRLIVETCWEVPGIESLEHMEELQKVELRANKGSAIQHCIQTIKKWPKQIIICTRAVPDAFSLVDSLLSPNIVVSDSFSKPTIKSSPKLVQKRSSNGDAIMLCFVINCVSSKMNLEILLKFQKGVDTIDVKIPGKGKWAWIAVFTQRSMEKEIEITIRGILSDCEVEKGVIVRGEEQRVVEAFHSLFPLLQT